MKKLILLFVLFCTNLPVLVADDYIPTLVEGKSWEYEYHRFDKGEDGNVIGMSVHKTSYSIEGDTVIDGKSYFCLMRTFESQPKVYFAALREEGTTLFSIPSSKQMEVVLLEFDARKFSQPEVQADDYTDITDTISVNGRLFRRHHYKPTLETLLPMTAVEGIGFEDNGLVGGMSYDRPTGFVDYENFVACYENGECIFANNDFSLPAWQETSVPHIYSPYSGAGMFVDLQGRRLKGEPKRGLYIKDGKKVVK